MDDSSIWGREHRGEVTKELTKLWHLSWPVSATFLLNMSLNIVTVMFVGRLGPSKMAAASLGSSMAVVTGHSVLRGLSSAMNTLCGQSYGAGAYEAVGVLWQRGIAITGLATLPIIVMWMAAEPFLVWLGQEPHLAAMTAAYLRWRIPGLVAYGLYACATNYLQAQGIVRPPFAAAVLTALLHPLLNYVTIHVMDMDYLGAALALSVAYTLQLAFLLACTLGLKLHVKTWKGWSRKCLQEWQPFLRLAIPGLLLISELWAIEISAMLAGLLPDPAHALSIMAIYQTINGLYFMLPLGIGASATTRVAIELGAGRPFAAKRAAHLAMLSATAAMCVLAVPLFAFRQAWARVFTTDAEVARGVSKTLIVLAVSVLFDGVQTTVAGIMKGQGHQAVMVPIVLLSYYVVGLPLAGILAFPAAYGVVGLCLGILAGTVLHSSIFLLWLQQTDWKAAAAEALQAAGITLSSSSLVIHSTPSPGGSQNPLAPSLAVKVHSTAHMSNGDKSSQRDFSGGGEAVSQGACQGVNGQVGEGGGDESPKEETRLLQPV